MAMRTMVCFCLASGLFAGEGPRPEPPEPGRDRVFLARILMDTQGGNRPWRTFRFPHDLPSAVVEVLGELTPAQRREAVFQEFLAWFQEDLKRFLSRHKSGYAPAGMTAASLGGDRFGGNPVPRNVPLGRANF